MRASAHGARVRERPRRMASHSLGWVSGWARTARVGRIQLPARACACERSTARASLERPARVEGRPRAHPRATEAWRTGCGVAKGWDKKRAHRGGRARAEEVCTRVRGAFCQRLPGAPGRRPLMRDVIAPEKACQRPTVTRSSSMTACTQRGVSPLQAERRLTNGTILASGDPVVWPRAAGASECSSLSRSRTCD